MSLAAEDIRYIREHLGEWLGGQSLGKPPVVYEAPSCASGWCASRKSSGISASWSGPSWSRWISASVPYRTTWIGASRLPTNASRRC